QLITTLFMLICAGLSWFIFFDIAHHHQNYTQNLLTWIQSGSFEIVWSLRFDILTAVMLVVVSTVSAMVHLYSIGYMSHDKSIPRFMSYLSLFTFCMLMLVTSDNFLQLFFGWEGVGLCSYLLIGFWYERPSANKAAIKAFVVNRVGDFGFALGIMGVFFIFNSVDFNTVFSSVQGQSTTMIHFLGFNLKTMDTLCILLFIGAMGKSAQLGLHVWLPDAMEGPTPVSALIHAATMVTAGVFMVCRLSPMFEYAPIALSLVIFVGATTAFFAATIGMCQYDIKRVIAYSTCSQLGYMFVAAGVSAYGASMFHLFTHAFFKALLFLGAGSVIHAVSGEQDMRKMGGLARSIPITYAMMWVGNLALAGIGIPDIFGFAGFYSKDSILEAAWLSSNPFGYYAFWLGIITAFMTAFYSWRLLLITFHGKAQFGHEVHPHESPLSMLLPLVGLSVGALFAGYIFHEFFVGHENAVFWQETLKNSNALFGAEHSHLPEWVKWAPLAVGILGILLAYLCYMVFPQLPKFFTQSFSWLHRFVYNKWYVDELYEFIFVKPAFKIGNFLWKWIDGKTIDRFGPDGFAALTTFFARKTNTLQTGYLYHYAFVMIIGLILFITWQLINLSWF
ncbi:MAG: NADH-quinone oxidoreductase subunit L, partial [Alphaproteobacteria bacterium]|nr:NADH-quinone oxidoreductase subunit L [Alphaproteobacteria bacterium]